MVRAIHTANRSNRSKVRSRSDFRDLNLEMRDRWIARVEDATTLELNQIYIFTCVNK